ncbi:MAG TPA: hypothetical protein DCR97_11110 [Deltaproteobacteria bacterium]|jgi:CheY-like chemotaxis protein|nr:hypothetical protein [Deltaproteobacteria bacterium]
MGKRVLLVDGDIAVAETVKGMLEGMGHQVRMETSGDAALAIFYRDATEFDLVITELGMPDMSGFLLIERLFKVRPNLPIILLASAEGQAQSVARGSGIQWFGLKPLSITDLARTVESALTGKHEEAGGL